MERNRRFVRMAAMACLVAQVLLVAPMPGATRPAMAADDASATLAQGKRFYRNAEYAQCVNVLRPLADRAGLAGQEQIEALETLARCYVQLADKPDAVAMFGRVLDLLPSWLPDKDIETPDEIAVFKQAQGDWLNQHPPIPPPRPAAKAWWQQRSIQAVGGCAVAGGVLLMMHKSTTTKHTDPALPDPPGPPTGSPAR